MRKIVEIVVGWKNYLVQDEEIEAIAEKRMLTCLDCSSLNRALNTCRECGCYMVAKTRSPKSTCPRNKWKVIRSFEEWYNHNSHEIYIELAENGADREMGFDPEIEFEKRYQKYLEE